MNFLTLHQAVSILQLIFPELIFSFEHKPLDGNGSTTFIYYCEAKNVFKRHKVFSTLEQAWLLNECFYLTDLTPVINSIKYYIARVESHHIT